MINFSFLILYKSRIYNTFNVKVFQYSFDLFPLLLANSFLWAVTVFHQKGGTSQRRDEVKVNDIEQMANFVSHSALDRRSNFHSRLVATPHAQLDAFHHLSLHPLLLRPAPSLSRLVPSDKPGVCKINLAIYKLRTLDERGIRSRRPLIRGSLMKLGEYFVLAVLRAWFSRIIFFAKVSPYWDNFLCGYVASSALEWFQ